MSLAMLALQCRAVSNRGDPARQLRLARARKSSGPAPNVVGQVFPQAVQLLQTHSRERKLQPGVEGSARSRSRVAPGVSDRSALVGEGRPAVWSPLEVVFCVGLLR